MFGRKPKDADGGDLPAAREQLKALRRRLEDLENTCRALKARAEVHVPEVLVVRDPQPLYTPPPGGRTASDDVFYTDLENTFRGSPEQIAGRQSFYLPDVAEAFREVGTGFFLDIGCGRGEFLGLLRSASIPAKGVDVNKVSVEQLKARGFDVTLGDGLEYVRSLPPGAIAGASMFQVIEHLDWGRAIELLRAVREKLAPRGLVVLETVNPHCPVALGNFHKDPSHVRPYPADMMQFLLEWHGFVEVKYLYSSPLPPAMRYVDPLMNYQDYAILARKAAGGRSG